MCGTKSVPNCLLYFLAEARISFCSGHLGHRRVPQPRRAAAAVRSGQPPPVRKAPSPLCRRHLSDLRIAALTECQFGLALNAGSSWPEQCTCVQGPFAAAGSTPGEAQADLRDNSSRTSSELVAVWMRFVAVSAHGRPDCPESDAAILYSYGILDGQGML